MILLSLLYIAGGRPQQPMPPMPVRTVYPDGWQDMKEPERMAQTFSAIELLHKSQPEIVQFEMAAKTYLTWKEQSVLRK